MLPEAWELVEDGLITTDDFRDFTFTNAVRLWGTQNPRFFEGTAVAKAGRRGAERAEAARACSTPRSRPVLAPLHPRASPRLRGEVPWAQSARASEERRTGRQYPRAQTDQSLRHRKRPLLPHLYGPAAIRK